MSQVDWAAARQRYFERLAPPDLRAGSRMVEELVGGGDSIRAVVQEVLRPAQIEVGRRWQLNSWTVADEHAASAVTEAALIAAARSAPEAAAIRGGPVVLACASGEWHTLPLRMVSEVLTEAGHRCVFLGPPVPAAHLRDYMARLQPLALALNCTLPLHLDGAAESIDAAHSVGVPVLAGGRAFGADAHRAAVVGADAWTDDPAEAAGILASWAAERPTVLASADLFSEEPPAGERELTTVRATVVTALCGEFPALLAYDERQWARTHEDVDHIVRFGVMAVRHRDESIFSEFAAWLREVLAARRVPPHVLRASLVAIAGALDTDRPRVGAWVRQAAGGDVVLADFHTV